MTGEEVEPPVGLVPRSYWMLTREQFMEALKEELEDEYAQRLAKFDEGAIKYRSEPVDLFGRDWEEQGLQEQRDQRNYKLFDRIFKLRRDRLNT